MTTNGAIAAANGLVAVALVFLGLSLLWQARETWRYWPVSALVALAGAYLAPGLAWAQIAAFRITDLPGPIGPNGFGTLALRIVAAGVVVALVQRVVRGRLLTDGDRARLDGGG